MRWLPLLLVLGACKRPADTPQGLDDSLRHLFHAFYGSDDDVAAGLSGLLDWYDSEGSELLGKSANIDNIGSFGLDPLTDADVEVFSPRPAGDPADASGVIAVAELPCRWKEAEALLIRPDQADVFTDFDFYDRSYVSSRKAYDGARKGDAYVDVRLATDAADFPPEALLVTENSTAGTEMGVTIPFDLHMHARHGEFDVLGDLALAGIYVTWIPKRAEAKRGVNSMEQSYTFEVDLERGGKTLWVYASWAEIQTSLFESDSAIVLATSANKAQGTAKRMADICEGKIAI